MNQVGLVRWMSLSENRICEALTLHSLHEAFPRSVSPQHAASLDDGLSNRPFSD